MNNGHGDESDEEGGVVSKKKKATAACSRATAVSYDEAKSDGSESDDEEVESDYKEAAPKKEDKVHLKERQEC